jgi:hypothetical protein
MQRLAHEKGRKEGKIKKSEGGGREKVCSVFPLAYLELAVHFKHELA